MRISRDSLYGVNTVSLKEPGFVNRWALTSQTSVLWAASKHPEFAKTGTKDRRDSLHGVDVFGISPGDETGLSSQPTAGLESHFISRTFAASLLLYMPGSS
jgi:hypothetical protein